MSQSLEVESNEKLQLRTALTCEEDKRGWKQLVSCQVEPECEQELSLPRCNARAHRLVLLGGGWVPSVLCCNQHGGQRIKHACCPHEIHSLVVEPATKNIQTGHNEMSPKPQSSVENGACSPAGGALGVPGVRSRG